MRSIGVDVGGTAVKLGAIDGNGTVIEERSIPVDAAARAVDQARADHDRA